MIKLCKNFGHEYTGKQCQKCKNMAHKRWREKHPEKVKENSRKYYEKNSEVIKQKVNEWRSENSEALKKKRAIVRSLNSNKFNEYRRQWRKENPDSVRREKFARRAKEKNCNGNISTSITKTLLNSQKRKCACCGVKLSKENMHRDHIVPLAIGGNNSDENIQLLCNKCNLSKGAKHPIDFMQSRGFLL